MHGINCSSAYTYSVYFSCLIFKLTRKQRLVTEFLHSSHIQYDILCYSVILIAVLLGKDKIRTPHQPTVCSLYCLNFLQIRHVWIPTNLFDCDFYWWPRAKQTTNSNMVWYLKGCVSLDPSKISKSGWWGLQLDTWQLCNSLWYGLINSKLHINKKIFFYITQHQTVSHVQCFKSPSWPLRDGLDLWPQLIYTLSWESQHKRYSPQNF